MKDCDVYQFTVYFFYLRKLSQLRFRFCSTALVIDTFYVKCCYVLMQYYNIDLLIGITIKKYIFLDPILCNFMRPYL